MKVIWDFLVKNLGFTRPGGGGCRKTRIRDRDKGSLQGTEKTLEVNEEGISSHLLGQISSKEVPLASADAVFWEKEVTPKTGGRRKGSWVPWWEHNFL